MVPVSEHLMNLWKEAITDLNLPEHESRYLEPFTVFGFELFHAGTIRSKYGAIIGIPINFTYESVTAVDPSPIMVNNEPVNWNRQDAKELLNALILSDDAKRYGLAREILMSKNNSPLITSAIASFMVSSTYALCQGINRNFKLFERPLPIRGFCYFVSCLFSFGIWATQIDIYNTYQEREADAYIAQLDERYTEGAIEFYTKNLSRNIAMRSLLGTAGEGSFTQTGNEKFLFRQPRLPLEKRKAFFEDNLAEIRRKKEVLNAGNT